MNGKAFVCLMLGGVMALLATMMLVTGELNISSSQMTIGGTVRPGEVITFSSHPGTFSVMLGVFIGFSVLLFTAGWKLMNRRGDGDNK